MRILNREINVNKIFLILISVFVIVCWVFLIQVTELAPPDFYNYYFQYRAIVSGDFSWHVPVGYPLISGIFGGLLSLIFSGIDTNILAGRLISLFFGMVFIYFSFKIFKKFLEDHYISATLLLAVQAFFLKFMAVPLTDIVFLSFTVMSFYYLSEDKGFKSLIVAFLSMFVRFEGILLLFSLAVCSLKKNFFRKRASLYGFFAIIVIFILYVSFSSRLINKILFLIESKSFLFFVANPLKLFKLLYLNIFFFIPGQIPQSFQYTIFFISFMLFFYGAYTIYVKNRRFFYSVLLYFFSYIILKGYIVGIGGYFNPATQGRRLLGAVFIYWLLLVIGSFTLIKNIKISGSFPGKLIFYPLFMVFLVFSFLTGISKVKKEIASYPKKGSFMLAKWIDSNLENGDRIIIYSSGSTLEYYLKKNIKKDFYIIKSRKRVFETFMKKFVMDGYKYILSDLNQNRIDKPYRGRIKRMLNKISRKKSGIFVRKDLYYKRKKVAFVLKLDNKYLEKRTVY